MCGIAGYFSSNTILDARELACATNALAHRGPDGMQVWISPDGRTGLGHTRLAVIDLQTGQQPMSVLDGRFIGTFNGEIYNFRQLRSQLESLGYRFRTQSDTEVLLLAYAQWAQGCFSKLDGMFAFAIFDANKRSLLLARDRTGIKPLYYHQTGNTLVFGSELKSVLSWAHVPRRLSHSALADYVALGYPIAPATCFKDCCELEPGTFLEISDRETIKRRYWFWRRIESDLKANDALELLEDELTKAVCEQQIADVPLGAFLSGGLDSSLLVTMLSGSRGSDLKTFTVKFGDQSYDESASATLVARHVGTDHHELRLEQIEDDLTLVSGIVDQFDQPFGDSSAIPTFLLSREIRRYVKVVIGGDGGDEMFGGYGRFAYADWARDLGMAPALALRGVTTLLERGRILSPENQRQVFRMLRAAAADGDSRLRCLCSLVPEVELSEMITDGFKARIGDYRSTLLPGNGHQRFGGRELIDATVLTTLPADYLRKVDIMSSAHGLEVRVPMLSNRIVDFASRLPNGLKYTRRVNKVLLRKLAALRLPPVIARRPKQGFGIPLDSWLGPRAKAALHEILTKSSSCLYELITPSYVQRVMQAFSTQRWDRSRWSRYGLYQRVYMLWSLQRWLDKWQPSL